MMQNLSKAIFLAFCCLIVTSCTFRNRPLTGNDIELFKRTPVWELAKAVERQDVNSIKSFLNGHKDVDVNYQEPKLGFSLLIWAVYNNCYEASECLLNHGADPNLKSTYSGTSAILWAADYLETSKYLSLLLKYGADPNDVALKERSYRVGTPLVAAASNRLESVKLLVESGADIDYVFYNRENAIKAAMVSEKSEIVYYLLVDCHAKFYEPPKYANNKPFIRWLRTWTFPLDSEDYKVKMKIVDFLAKQGYDYWATEIPAPVLKHYPEEYCDKY
ncbi:ankyrin repeat domain-containing protein [Puteibacter caeruleilacunae]|nr:ankyrin repeat domain-containing protein [Puteibacter caeruleilacunae]